MERNGLISKLIMPVAFAGLVGLAGCAADNSETTKTPLIINRELVKPAEITTQPATPVSEELKRAVTLYWSCKLLVGEEKLHEYDSLIWGRAYEEANSAEPRDKLRAAVYDLFKDMIKNKRAFDECLEAVRYTQRTDWKTADLGKWPGLKKTTTIIVAPEPASSYLGKRNGKKIDLTSLGEVPFYIKGEKRWIEFCKEYFPPIGPMIPKEPAWEIKSSPGKD